MFCGLPMGVHMELRLAATVSATTVAMVARGARAEEERQGERDERDERDVVGHEHRAREHDVHEHERQAAGGAHAAHEPVANAFEESGSSGSRHNGHEAEQQAYGAHVDVAGVDAGGLRGER